MPDAAIRAVAVKMMREKATGRVPLEKVCAVLAAYDRGNRLNKIAKDLDVHHSRVKSILDAGSRGDIPRAIPA